MKTNELTGAALDWAVAVCEFGGCKGWDGTLAGINAVSDIDGGLYRPSIIWEQGGPLIERHCINIFRLDPKSEDDNRFWLAHVDGIYCRYGVSALTAAMRCYVASKLGDEVNLPEELK